MTTTFASVNRSINSNLAQQRPLVINVKITREDTDCPDWAVIAAWLMLHSLTTLTTPAAAEAKYSADSAASSLRPVLQLSTLIATHLQIVKRVLMNSPDWISL